MFLPSNLLFLFTKRDWKGLHLQSNKVAYLQSVSGLPVRMANLPLCCSCHLTLSPLNHKNLTSHLVWLWACPLILHQLCRNSVWRGMDTILSRLQSLSLSVCTQTTLRAPLSRLPHLCRAWESSCCSHWEGFLESKREKENAFFCFKTKKGQRFSR